MRRVTVILTLFVLTILNITAQRYRAVELKSICNGYDQELAPVVYDSGIVYISNKLIPSTKKYVNDSGEPLMNIYYVPLDGSTINGKPEILSKIFSTDADDGPLTFAQNNQMVCFCRQNGFAGLNLPENGFSGLYFAYKSGGQWGNIIPFEHNDVNYNFNTPYLTPDGLTLYFAVDGMDDSFGGWDIYVSRMDGSSWSKPENMGGKINTAEWDLFPFLHPGGQLYFSSRGHNARGGSFDLFSSNLYKGEWSDPVAVPSLNSYNDELGLIINDDLSKGYFSRKTGGDFNIFEFEYANFESFNNPRKIQPNRFCFRLRENSLDTIDYTIFSYEWIINDTLNIPGHDIKFCFPGPGEYYLSFNVTNKVTDTVMHDVANLFLKLELMEQPVITAPDTVIVRENVDFSALKTEWNRWDIEGYYWDFGNGVQEKGKEVSYQYPLPGEYTVVLGIKEKVRNKKYEPEKSAVYKDIVVLPVE